jgi:hypothetical protein
MPSYLVHDNGGRPFKVEVAGNRVTVFRRVEGPRDRYEDEPAVKLTALKVFVGSDRGKHRGNTVLVQTGPEAFVFIGERIFSFKAKDPVKYVSKVGNSDVPYPFLETDEYYYLMLSGAGRGGRRVSYRIRKEMVPKGADPYDVHYGAMATAVKQKETSGRRRTDRKTTARKGRGKTIGLPYATKLLHKRM